MSGVHSTKWIYSANFLDLYVAITHCLWKTDLRKGSFPSKSDLKPSDLFFSISAKGSVKRSTS